MSKLSVIIMGAGGHARILASTLLLTGTKVLGFTEKTESVWGSKWHGISVIGGDEQIDSYSIDDIYLVNGLGSVNVPNHRKIVFEQAKDKGYNFAKVIHPHSYISPYAEIGEGAQIMAGAIVQDGAKIHSNVIINTGAIVEHDCIIESDTHIAPGVTLSGGVKIGSCCHIGVGAVVIQGASIGDRSLVGAGSVVLNSCRPYSKLIGIPAKIMD